MAMKIFGKYSACCPPEARRSSPPAAIAIAGYITGLAPKRLSRRAVMPADMVAMATALGRKAAPVFTGL